MDEAIREIPVQILAGRVSPSSVVCADVQLHEGVAVFLHGASCLEDAALVSLYAERNVAVHNSSM